MRVRLIFVYATILAVALATPAFAQKSDDVLKHPGYVNFAALGLPDPSEASVEVNLRGSLLKLVGLAAQEDEPEMRSLMNNLELVRVLVYPAEDLGLSGFTDKAAELAKRLEKDGWETLVRVRERDETAYIAVKLEGEKVVGLTVLACEKDDEVVFVNIAGLIDMEEIWRLGHGLDIDPLDSLRNHPNVTGKKAGKP
jgi:hypothetical protein